MVNFGMTRELIYEKSYTNCVLMLVQKSEQVIQNSKYYYQFLIVVREAANRYVYW